MTFEMPDLRPFHGAAFGYRPRKITDDIPHIVCLCGSTRFMDQYHEANRQFSLAGCIVLTVEIVTYDGAQDPQRANPLQKELLDELHLRKIDLADSVFVINVGGYVGESTRKEIEYAQSQGKMVRYLEPTDLVQS